MNVNNTEALIYKQTSLAQWSSLTHFYPTHKKKKKYVRHFLNKVFSGIWHNFQLSKYCINLYPRLSRTYLEPKLYETMYSCTFSCIFIRLKSLLYEIIFYNTITRTNLLLILSYCLIKWNINFSWEERSIVILLRIYAGRAHVFKDSDIIQFKSCPTDRL